jgi:Penicillin-Binding Protein C-terminus Family
VLLENKNKEEKKMKNLTLAALAIMGVLFGAAPTVAQEGSMKGMEMPMKHMEKMSPESSLQPAEGASVKIVSPTNGQVINGDTVPLEFKMTKGKRGEHVHAYVDGELMGMFKSAKGTLTGIKPGKHTLELRVATSDHNTELKAIDKVSFTTK